MRICFITPPSVFLLDERVFPNLGILKVAACCRDRGHQVEHLDLDGVANFEDAAMRHAADSAPDWFCLTATTPQMPAAARIAAALRQGSPSSKLMLGGPHPTLTLAAVKLEQKRGLAGRAARALDRLRSMFDVLVAGDGEDAVEQALHLPTGVVDGDDPSGPLFLSRARLAQLPWPARELVDLDSYHYTIDGVPATSIICQLGCPFGCAFCGGRASPMLRRARSRPTADVLAEVEHLHNRYGYRGFMLYDDEMNVSPTMMELMRGFVALQKRLGVEFRLRGFVKSELVTAEQCEVMYEAGFRWLLCGFEAASPRILENIQKRATVEDNDRCVALARAAGLKVKALMSIGHAGESMDSIDAIRGWLLRTRPDDFDCTIITTYPGSPYYDEALPGEVAGYKGMQVWTYRAPATGDRLHAFEVDHTVTADYYKGQPDGGYRAYVFTDALSPEDLVRERDSLERDVRAALAIPFNPARPAVRYEHSMGQAGALPPSILRTA